MQNEGELDHTNLEEDGLEVSSLGGGIQNVREKTQENRTIFSVPQSPTMKRKLQKSVDTSLLVTKHLKQASDVLQSLVKKPNSQQNKSVSDGPELYAQLLAESPRNRLLLEHKIDNMVFEAIIQEMDSETQGRFPITINTVTVSSPCSSLESYISHGSTYSTREFSHSPSSYEQSPGTTYAPHLTANHVYIQPSQSQQQNVTVPLIQSSTVLEFYSNSDQFVNS